MTPASSTDPTYSDPKAAADWLADVVARGKAKAQGKGRAVTDVEGSSAEEALLEKPTPPAADRGDDG